MNERFPSPVMGNGPGEYQRIEEYEAAQRAIEWTRNTAKNTKQGERDFLLRS